MRIKRARADSFLRFNVFNRRAEIPDFSAKELAAEMRDDYPPTH
jgi:hypothetical protein